MCTALTTLFVATKAQAQEPSTTQLEADARAQFEAGLAGNPEAFETCAKLYLEIYNTYDKHAHPEQLLWLAAQCSEAAGALGQAILVRKTLLQRYPDSSLAADVLFGLAESHASIAEYNLAAEYYEDFVSRYRKDARGPDALQNAYLFRVGLKQTDAAKHDLATFETLYATGYTAQAAQIFWMGHELLDSPKQRRQHALDYLDAHEWRGGADREIVAEATIAQIDWRRSCPEPLLFDTCVSIERSAAKPSIPGVSRLEAAQVEQLLAEIAGTKPKRYRPPKYCASPTSGVRVTVHKRNAKLAQAAQQRFKTVLKLVQSQREKIDIPPDDWARVAAFKNAWGMAMVYRADQSFETYLALALPTKLDFYTDWTLRDSGLPAQERLFHDQIIQRDQSMKRLAQFYERKLDLGRDLLDDYTRVKETGSPSWVLTGASRSAMIMETFADQLQLAKIPREHRSQETVAAYCDVLAEFAAPVTEQAVAAWEYCTSRSTDFQFFTEFSRECEARAAEHAPQRYPPTHELFGTSVYAGGGVVSVGLLPESGIEQAQD